eukprot:scaffold2028_cov74-Cyclotella_meneghiniana.AAC.16
MGKSSRSRRSTKREVQVLDFSNWINENLASFDHRDYENESSVQLLLRVARHWMKPECKNFFYFADKLCRGSKRSTFRMTYSNVLLENVLDAMDNGNVTMAAAKVWLMSFGLLMQQEMSSLIDIIHVVEKNARAKTSSTHDGEWLLKINQTLFVNNCLQAEVAFKRFWITVVNKSGGEKMELFINITCRIKVLMTLFESHAAQGMVNFSSRCYRIVHRGRSIFLSDGGDEKRLHELGVQDKDVIIIVEINNRNHTAKIDQSGTPNEISAAKNVRSKSDIMPRPKRVSCRKSSTSYETVIPDRVRHSGLLTRVFEEADYIFTKRRLYLASLAIKKCNPKTRQKTNKILTPTSHNISTESTAGKPGRVYFPITVGDHNYLYRSSKEEKLAHPKTRQTVDLHGCTKSQAIEKLNKSLPKWIEFANRSHPYTVNVDVICGGGKQLLSEAVEQWIRESRHVANRFA